MADHLITGPHVHTIVTGVVLYLATAGLTLTGTAGLTLGAKAVWDVPRGPLNCCSEQMSVSVNTRPCGEAP
ncbi:hypothetical protein [Caulobacter sp. AP07]|uniref:hypothetical protein n=1 Tax=Caulobacter sp. AP07 TaxID=1144304 RepID=UPI0012FA10A4|nr:hypothetical protein [Caulobacter sp. AP07]